MWLDPHLFSWSLKGFFKDLYERHWKVMADWWDDHDSGLRSWTNINVSGKIGVGTNNPQYSIDVVGDIRAIETGSAPVRGIISYQASSDQASAHFSGEKSRGTPSAPTAVVALDYITVLAANPYDGTSYLLPGFIGFQVTPGGSVSTGVVPTDVVITTGTGTPADGTERLRIDNAGHMGVNKGGVSDTNGTLSVTALSSTNAARFLNNDNTFTTVTIINSGTARALDLSSGLSFTNTGVGIVGSTTNDAANTGVVGEYKEADTGGAINFPATGNFGDGPSFSLTAGDWDVSVQIDGNVSAVANVTLMGLGVSTTTGNSSTGLTQGTTILYVNPPASSQLSWAIPRYRFSLSGTTTIYTKVTANYTGTTPQFAAMITARRMR